ncbi:MAG TPA: hypothetical protein VFO76_07985 [Candidatus Kapabacteria bacterium]|nr:hypothetical protein [Candidatus Kapabacteria bacterium]
MNVRIPIGFLMLVMVFSIGCGSSTEPTETRLGVTLDAIFLPKDTLNLRKEGAIVGQVLGHFSNIPYDDMPCMYLISGKNPALSIYDTTTFQFINSFGYIMPPIKGNITEINFNLQYDTGALIGFQPGDTIYFKAYPFTGYGHVVMEEGKRNTYKDLGPPSNALMVYWEK